MDLSDFDFDLPEDRIARFPSPKRGDSRLLVIDRQAENFADRRFSELPQLLTPGDLLIFNHTRVSARRVRLRRRTGADIEAVFLEEQTPGTWSVLLRGRGRLKPGEELIAVAATQTGLTFRFSHESHDGPGNSLLTPLTTDGANAWHGIADAESFFELYGELPIPPYLGRAAEAVDTERYQTVLAREGGSVAAPTAGLHFSETLLGDLQERGIKKTSLEVQIGYGTFAPLSTENFATGELHREVYRIPDECARAYADQAGPDRGRRVAVGTTTLRALESETRAIAGQQPTLRSGFQSTTLFIYPPEQVRSVDALITNFHLPQSSLLLFVAAFTGTDLLMKAYHHAVNEGYRFYSYGDAMLVIDGPTESS